MIDCPESFTQEEVDEEVTKKCSCPEAQAMALKEYNRNTAAAFLKDAFKDDEYMQEVMNMNLDAAMDEAIEKVTIVQKRWVDDKVVETKTYTMSLNADSKLIMNVKQSYSRKEKF